MRGFNAKIGCTPTNKVTGQFGLRERNERGYLVQFCIDNNLVIQNTWFQLSKQRLYTWRSPRDGHNGSIVCNQIDFILTNQRFRNCVQSVKTYPAADINSDHNLLCGKIKLHLKKVAVRNKRQRFNFEGHNHPMQQRR